MTNPYEEDVFRVLIAVCEFSDQADKKDVIEIEHQVYVTVFCSEPRSSVEVMDILGSCDCFSSVCCWHPSNKALIRSTRLVLFIEFNLLVLNR